MKVIVYERYGPPETLRLAEVEKPTPKENQILVKVHAASANALDWRGFAMGPILRRVLGGVRGPKDPRLGADVAGTVEAVGSAVTDFKPGDEVFGVAPGSFAEYVANGASKFALKPANVTFEEAAAVPVAAFTALQGLRDKGGLQAGHKALIYGASGGVGTLAVQIAKALGAEVTAVVSTRNLDMARDLGADHVIDYRRKDFATSGQRYDLIYAVNGSRALRDYKKSLTPHGVCVVAGGSFPQIIRALALGRFLSEKQGRKVIFQGIATSPKEDLQVIREMLEAGKITPVIDKCYPLTEAGQAIRYLIDEHARGKVIVSVA